MAKSFLTRDLVSVILGGGRGERLWPLTNDRAKPAVPFAGKYRLIDIPISNCLNSGVNKIFVLTQYSSASLNNHVSQTYRFDPFSRGYVQVLAAEQTIANEKWYQGTADAVRHNLSRILHNSQGHVLILSGDQLYKMDYRKILNFHLEKDADLTVAVLPVNRDDARGFGILHVNDDARIVRFVEKPKEDDILDSLKTPDEVLTRYGMNVEGNRQYLASMGIYIFKNEILARILEDTEETDFGRDIIPAAIDQYNVFGYMFDGYWEDIGTIRSFYEANINLASVVPDFDFYDEENRIYTHPRFLPGSKINNCTLNQVIIAGGCILDRCEAERSVIGVRTVIRAGCRVCDSVILGADFFEKPPDSPIGVPPLGIGTDTVVRQAIIDKNVRIGKNVQIVNVNNHANFDGDNYAVRDGIVVIPRNTIIHDNTII